MTLKLHLFNKITFNLVLDAIAAGDWKIWQSRGAEIKYRTAEAKTADITQAVSANGTLKPVVLVNVGTGYLEAQLNKLDGDSGDPTKGSGLLLSSTGCNIYETNQDMLIDLFGGAQPKDRCTWDMTLTIGGAPQAIKGKFFAQRQQ